MEKGKEVLPEFADKVSLEERKEEQKNEEEMR